MQNAFASFSKKERKRRTETEVKNKMGLNGTYLAGLAEAQS